MTAGRLCTQNTNRTIVAGRASELENKRASGRERERDREGGREGEVRGKIVK